MTLRSLSAHRLARPVGLGAVLLVALTGTLAAYRADTRTVALSVDGTTRTVSLHGGTVADVLSKAGLRVGSHDLLAPAATTAVKDGSRIVLRHGRPMTLVVDGTSRVVWVTATSVDEALAQVDLRLGDAELSADRSREIPLKGFSLDVRTRKDVQLLVAGRVRRVATHGLLVQDALRAARVALRPADRLSVPVLSRLHDGQVISLTRIDGRRLARDVAIPFGTVRRADAGLAVGTTRLVRAGRVGIRHQTFLLSFVNGRLAGRRLATNVQTSDPVTRVVAVGTRPAPVARASSPPPVSSSGGLNWGALAACESGGNPRAVSSSGTYRGLYQFDFGTWASVGGSGDPIDASASEQTARAQILYSRAGRSPWPVCGRYL